MTGFNLAAWVLNVYGPESEPAEEGSAYRWGESDAHVLEALPLFLKEMQENLQDLLPAGYTVSLTPWEGT